MERIAPNEGNIVALAAALCPPQTRVAASDESGSAAPDSGPDPRALLEAERAAVLEAARQEGYRDGLRKAQGEIQERANEAEKRARRALDDERSKLEGHREQMRNALEALNQAVEHMRGECETAVVEIAYAALVRMLGRAQEQRPLVVEVCREVLDEYRLRPVVVHLSDVDAEVVQQAGLAAEGVRIAADPQLRRGQCRIESHRGQYETGLEARLEALKQAFLEGLSGSEVPR